MQAACGRPAGNVLSSSEAWQLIQELFEPLLVIFAGEQECNPEVEATIAVPHPDVEAVIVEACETGYSGNARIPTHRSRVSLEFLVGRRHANRMPITLRANHLLFREIVIVVKFLF